MLLGAYRREEGRAEAGVRWREAGSVIGERVGMTEGPIEGDSIGTDLLPISMNTLAHHDCLAFRGDTRGPL